MKRRELFDDVSPMILLFSLVNLGGKVHNRIYDSEPTLAKFILVPFRFISIALNYFAPEKIIGYFFYDCFNLPHP